MSWAVLGLVLALTAVGVAISLIAGRTIRRHDAPRADGLPTGEATAARIVAAHDLGVVTIEAGDVDCYVAADRTIQLADGRLERASVSAAAVAAHEAAHLLQHATGYRPWRIWWVLVIPALLADAGFILLLPWLLLFDWPALTYIAAALLGVVALAGVISAVVEIDASRRALRELRAQGLSAADLRSARRLLVACGATYVSEAVFDIGYVGRRLRRDDDDLADGSAGGSGGGSGGGDGDLGGGSGGGGGGDGF